ncbi:PucR family transcriptional regulator [Mycobacterium sp. NPDC051198]
MDLSSPDARRSGSGTALLDVLRTLAASVLETVVAPHEADRPVRAVQVWASDDKCVIARDAVVFAIGVGGNCHACDELLTACEAANAVLVVRDPQPSLIRTARDTGVPLFKLAPAVSWDRAVALLRGALVAGADCAAPLPWDGTEDLGDLADAAAVALDVPVDVTDHRLRLMAFSSIDDFCDRDELRVDTILHRRVPTSVESWLHDSGQLARIARAATPVRITPPGQVPRWVMPLRTGPEVIGYLWLLPFSGTLDESTAGQAADIARSFAARLARAALSDGQRRASELLRGVLEDRLAAAALSDAVENAAAVRLIGFRTHDDTGLHHLDRCHLESLISMRIGALGFAPITATVGSTIYALAASAGDDLAELRALADDIVVRAARQLGAKLVAVIGGFHSDVTHLRRARGEIDRALRIHANGGVSDVVALDDIAMQCILHEFAELADERPHLLAGSLDVLAESDRTKNTSYLPTLMAYFDANCDLAGTANSMYLHRNTIRYRLQRIHAICGLDLDAPLDRLITEMQLRLLHIRNAAVATRNNPVNELSAS